MTNREWRRYLRDAAKQLCCGRRRRKDFCRKMNAAWQALQAEQPQLTMEQCRQALGTPAQAARAYLEDVPEEQLAAERRGRTRRTALLAGTAAALVLALGVTSAYLWQNLQAEQATKVRVEQHTIIYEGDVTWEQVQEIAEELADEMERRHTQ